MRAVRLKIAHFKVINSFVDFLWYIGPRCQLYHGYTRCCSNSSTILLASGRPLLHPAVDRLLNELIYLLSQGDHKSAMTVNYDVSRCRNYSIIWRERCALCYHARTDLWPDSVTKLNMTHLIQIWLTGTGLAIWSRLSHWIWLAAAKQCEWWRIINSAHL